MKASALMRIMLYTLIAIVLTGMLIWGIGGEHNMNFFSFNLFGASGQNYNDKGYAIGEGEVDKDLVNEIDVDWTAGNVKVNIFNPEITGTDTISISETSDIQLEQKYEMRYKVEDGVLKIRFAKPNVKFKNIFKSLDKELTINVPIDVDLNDIKIETVSANINLDSVSVENEIKLATVSGDISTNRSDGDSLDAETVSGEIRTIDAINGSVRIESVSGDVYATFRGGAPSFVSIETVSGEMTLGFPKTTEGFTVEYDKVSGNFDCEFNVQMSKNKAIYKDGDGKIKLETVSGDMKILAL